MRKLLTFLLAIPLLAACSSDDPKTTLDGNWNLVRVEGGLTGVNDNFAQGEIKWKFSTAEGTLTVTNNNTDDEKEDMLVSGDYSYHLMTNGDGAECSRNIMIDVVDFGCYQLQGQRLKIGSTESDGYLLTLER